MNRIIRILLLGMALMFSAGAFAQNAGASNFDSLKAALDPANMSPYSAAQYGTIFGCPGGLFEKGGECKETVVGYVAGQFNTIAFVMGVVVLMYIMIGGAINTAASGEVLGKAWSSAWLPIRVFMAFGLIIPTANIAPYSPSQIAPMYAIVLGDNLATAVTKNIAAKVADKTLTISGSPPKIPSGASIDIAGSVFCAANEWHSLTLGGKTNLGSVDLYTVYTQDGLSGSKATTFAPNTMPGNYADLVGQGIIKIKFGSSGKCGTMDLPYTSEWRDLYILKEVFSDDLKKQAYSNVTDVVLKEMDFYAKLENEMRTAGLDDEVLELALKSGMELPKNLVDPYNEKLKKITENAAAFQGKVSSALDSSYSTETPKSFLNREIIHYTDINKLLHKMAVSANAPNEAALEMMETVQNNSWDECFAATRSCREKMNSEALEELLDGVKVQSTMMGIDLMKQVVKSSSTESSFDSLDVSDTEGFSATSWLQDGVKGIKISILEAFSDYSEGDSSKPGQAMNFTLNPMVLLHNIGTIFAGISGVMIIIMGKAAIGATAALTATPLYLYIQSLVMPLIYGLIGMASMFVYISIIPIVMGIWGYLSIIIMGIQGVSAAPFAVVLLATPEGNGMMTQTFQRFLLHWVHLALAPMIFVLGAVASLSLMIVGGNIVIWTFIVDMNFYGSDSWVIIIASLFIFIWVLWQIVMNLSMFQLSLQSEIMEILGGGFHKPLGHDMQGQTLRSGAPLGGAARFGVTTAGQSKQQWQANQRELEAQERREAEKKAREEQAKQQQQQK